MKKFTEKEYQKIVDCFERLNDEYNFGLMNDNLICDMQNKLAGDFYFVDDWAEIVAVANPATRQWAHDQFVEQEKKYRWTSKKKDEDGDRIYLCRADSGGAIVSDFFQLKKKNY